MTREACRFSAVVVLIAILGLCSVRGQESNTEAARMSAEAWLALIDSQNYAASWDTAASGFRSAITQEKWVAAAQAARAPLGPVKSRALKSATATKTLPGAPDGDYVVFQFNTSFGQKAEATETVTAIREKDGTWHIGGYFIK